MTEDLQRAIDLLLPRPTEVASEGRVERPRTLLVDTSQAGLASRDDTENLLRPLHRLAPAILESVSDDSDTAPRLTGAPRPTPLVLRRDESIPTQGYHLVVEGEEWRLAASSEPGFFYGLQTLSQWLRLQAATPQTDMADLRAHDAPSIATRAYLLDISRNKVPKLSTLEEWIDRLAELKYNHLQLYTEHTFAYQGHEVVWQGWSPLTPADVRHLERYCADRFIELTPNQNSFGHFHRWLVHEKYRPLAECPEGIDHPFSLEREPFSLCAVDPEVTELLADLYSQLLPLFSSNEFNVGLDETFDLGLGRSKEAVERTSRSEVYLDFVNQVRELAARYEKRILLWGDIVLEHPELVERLPEDCIVLGWGYEAGHAFAENCAAFAAAGVEHWVCPGTSSWNSFAGRATNAVRNIGEAALAATEHSASGLLLTDWGDSGHLQPRVVSGPAVLAAAAASWNADQAERAAEFDGADSQQVAQLAEQLDWWWFDDPAPGLGAALLTMADYYRLATKEPLGKGPFNGSGLFHQLQHITTDQTHSRFDSLSTYGCGDVARSASLVYDGLLTRDPSPERDALLWVAKACLVFSHLAIARAAHDRSATVEALEPQLRSDFVERIEDLAQRRRRLWMRTNRAGGWHASRVWFDRAIEALR